MEATSLTLSKGKLRTADLDYSSPVPALSVQVQPPLQLIHSANHHHYHQQKNPPNSSSHALFASIKPSLPTQIPKKFALCAHNTTIVRPLVWLYRH